MSVSQEINIGTVLQNRYKIISILGKGGMGRVYLAEQTHLGTNKQVAIKEMFEDFYDPSQRQSAIAQFETEAHILANLDHSNLPKVYDYFEENNIHYLVMDYIDGITLKKYLETHSPVSDDQVKDWARQLLEVLDYLHTRPTPIIFRDLKPENIIVDSNNKLKLIDFGIAKLLQSSTDATRTIIKSMGSPGFAALLSSMPMVLVIQMLGQISMP